MEGNRAKFRMNEQEVADRRKFVTDTRATVAQMKKDIDNPVTRAKVERDQRSVHAHAHAHAPPHTHKHKHTHTHTRLCNWCVDNAWRWRSR